MRVCVYMYVCMCVYVHFCVCACVLVCARACMCLRGVFAQSVAVRGRRWCACVYVCV